MISASETWSFDTARIGRRTLVFDRLASTNTTAADLALSADVDGLVVLANHQSAGRGQYGRVWQSRPGSSLLMSVLVFPPAELRRPAFLTALAAAAVAEAIAVLSGLQARIKWPNDLLVRDKKVCGILIEQHGAAAILGIGLNLNQTAEEFVAAGLPGATSLALASGGAFDVRSAAGIVIPQLDRHYERLLAGDRKGIEAEWTERMALVGRRVAVEWMDGSTTKGRLRALAFDGLELEEDDGSIRQLAPEAIRHILGI